MKYPHLAKRGFTIAGTKGRVDRPLAKSEYEGASTGRRLGGWTTFASGPNSSGDETFSVIRARARDAIRNNPWAASALASYSANLVGRGIVPRWKLEEEGLRAEVQSLWEDWVPEADADGLHDFYGLQNLVTKTMIHSGEAIVRFRPRRVSDGLSVPLQLQVLEPDFLDEGKNGPAPGGNTYHQGIEFNAIGQRVAYWIRKQHPGDSFLGFGNMQSFRVPASEILHIYRVDRPGQLRGVSWYAPILARLYILDEYEDAELDRKKTAALFGAFVTKNGDLAGPGGMVGFGTDENEDDLGRPFADLEPGMLNYLLPGEDVTFSTPADVGGSYEVWITRQFQACAAGLGITYEQMTGDVSKVNFSSLRARSVEFRRVCRQIIGGCLNFQFNQKVAQRFMSLAVASGELKIADFNTKPRKYRKIEWRPDGWEYVNPKEDVETELTKVRAGFKTREAVIDETSEDDIETIDKANAERNKKMDDQGLVYDSDPRKVSSAGLTQARPKGSILPPPEVPEDVESVEPEPGQAPAFPGGPPGAPGKAPPAGPKPDNDPPENTK